MNQNHQTEGILINYYTDGIRQITQAWSLFRRFVIVLSSFLDDSPSIWLVLRQMLEKAHLAMQEL